MLRIIKGVPGQKPHLSLWGKIVLVVGYGTILYFLMRGLVYVAVLLA